MVDALPAEEAFTKRPMGTPQKFSMKRETERKKEEKGERGRDPYVHAWERDTEGERERERDFSGEKIK